MGYSAAADAIIAGYDIACEYKLELKPQGTDTWYVEGTDFHRVKGSLNIQWDEDVAAQLTVELANEDLAFSDETYPDSFTAVGTKVRCTSYIRINASTVESRVEFLGEIVTPAPADQRFTISAFNDYWRLTKAICRITDTTAPLEVAIVSGSTRRAVTQIDPQLGEAYGFSYTGPGDLAFVSSSIRRPWSDRGLRVWKHATDTYFTNGDGNLDTYELAQEHYRVDYRSGALTIIEDDPDATYYISGVGAYVETQLGAYSATSVPNADYARLWETLLLFPADEGGMGCTLGTEWGNAITAVSTGSKQFTIAGDYSEWYTTGKRIYVQSATGNDGSYSIASVALSGGNTLIVVNETVPDGTADGFVTLDSSLDMPGIMPFDLGKCSDFTAAFIQDFQRNVRLVFDDDSGKYWLLTIVQKEAGSADLTLYHPKSIDQTRESGELYTAVLYTGRKTRPINLVQQQGVSGVLVTKDTSGDNDWFRLNGTAIEQNNTNFAAVKEALYDGFANTAVGLHNLSATADLEPGASAYEGWFFMFGGTLDPGQPVRHIEFTAGPTRNPNAANGHQGYFWPGNRLQISDDNITWLDMTPLLNGRFSPGSDVTIDKEQIPRRYGRYWRMLGAAYKGGDSNQADPWVTCASLRLYQDFDYEILASISPMHPIVARATGAGGTLSFSGDHRREFKDGDTFTVRDNSGTGDGNYTVASSGVAYDSGTDRTTLTVTGTIPAGTTADGELYSTTDYILLNGDTVQRDYPDLWDRFGGRLRIYAKDLGERYNEQLARQFAIITLDEYLKLFQSASHATSVPDPRPRQYKTVAIPDEMNGDITTLLARRITKGDGGTTVWGTNYRSGYLGS